MGHGPSRISSRSIVLADTDPIDWRPEDYTLVIDTINNLGSLLKAVSEHVRKTALEADLRKSVQSFRKAEVYIQEVQKSDGVDVPLELEAWRSFLRAQADCA